MMRSFLFFIFSFFIFAAQAQTLTLPANNAGLGSGGNSVKRKPLGAYYGYERSAFIYSAYELGLTDTVAIQSIAFYMDSLNTAIATTLPVKIYLKDITDTAFTVATTPATELTGATLAFDGTLPNTAFANNTWVSITLSSPFIHYHVQNLEIIVESNPGGSGSDYSPTSKIFRRNTTTVKRFQYWQQDNTPPSGAGALDTLRPNITLNYTTSSICAGAPVAGVAQPSDTAVCVNSTVDLILTGNNVGSLLTYQWQLSTDGVTFTDIAGANQSNYTHTMTAPAWFRNIVTCGTNADTSTVGYVNLLLPIYCYCYTSLGGGCTNYSLDSLSIEGTTFHPALDGCENNVAPHYSRYPANGNYTATLTAGQTYTMTIRQTGNNITSLWIDFNHNGVFDSIAEWTQINTSSVTAGLASHTFKVDSNAYNGLTGMRVRTRASGVLNDSACACVGFTTGETEDFLISITGGGTIGLADHSTNADVHLFPNPNKGSFVIETNSANSAWQIDILDILGHVLFSKTEESGNGQINIQLDAAPGVYFVKGVNIRDRKAFTKKIVIEN